MRWLAFLLLLPTLCFAQFSDGFENGMECQHMTRWNMGIKVAPPTGGSDLKMQMSIQDLPARKGEALVGSLYGQGGTPPYAFSIVSGSLPPGVSMTAGGILSGTPTTVGLYPFLARVQDAALGVFICRFAINIIPAIEFTASTPTPIEVNVHYSYIFKISGATGSVTWSSSGTLPTGTTLNSATGELSGNPTLAGTFNFTITATDGGSGDSVDAHISVTVISPAVATFDNTHSPGTQLPDLTIGTAYVATVTVTGGVAPYSFFDANGIAFQLGLSVDSSTGEVSGTIYDPSFATSAGPFGGPPYTISLGVQDALGGSVLAVATLKVLNLSTDGTMAENSDSLYPSQAAVVTYVAANGGGVNTMAPVGSSPNANAATISGSTLTLQPASTAFPGVLSANDYGELQALAHAALGGM